MAKMLLMAQKYMNAEYALAAIKHVKKTSEKGRKEDDQRWWKRSFQIVRLVTRVKRKKKKLPKQ